MALNIRPAATAQRVLGWYNVKDFGAVGDGTTDDTSAWKAAFAAVPSSGGTVFIPAGTYNITGAINIPTSCSVEADGAEMSLGSSSAQLTVSGSSHVKIAGLKITGNQGTTTALSIGTSSAASYVEVTACHITQVGGNGIDVVSSSHVTISGNEIDNVGLSATSANGVYVIGSSSDVKVNQNTIHDITTTEYMHGIDFYGATSSGQWDHCQANFNRIYNIGTDASGSNAIQFVSHNTNAALRGTYGEAIGNQITKIGDSTIWVNGDHCTVQGNTIDTSQIGAGIEVEDCQYVAVAGNVIHAADTSGIWVHPGTSPLVGVFDVNVVGNSVDGSSANDGITVENDSSAAGNILGVAVQGNTASGNAECGIQITEVPSCTVIGNQCLNNSTSASGFAGIRLYGGSLSNCDGSTVQGNVCTDTRASASKTQTTGIYLQSGADNLVVTGNYVAGNVTNAVLLSNAGTSNVIAQNNGYNPLG